MECDENLNFVFIGDETFALKEHVLKTFSRKSLNYKRQMYNYRLFRAKNVVENVFGLISNRFCLLLTSIQGNPNIIKFKYNKKLFDIHVKN